MPTIDGQRNYRANLFATIDGSKIIANPYVFEVVELEDGYRVIISKGNDVQYFDVKHGFSPVISVEGTEDGHLVVITDSQGVHTFEVKDGRDGANGYYQSIVKQKDYLYVVNYGEIDYEYAKQHFENETDVVFGGACSSVSKGNYYGRNFDWTYDNCAEFVVNVPGYAGRHASHGIAGGISALTKAFVDSGESSNLYKILPFAILDGQNDAGLICSTNVVPTDYGENTSVPTLEERENICGSMLVRYILDKFDDPLEACRYIQRYVSVYFSENLHEKGYEQHYMIKKDNVVYCLEFVNDAAVYFDISDNPYLTNFYMFDMTPNADGTVYTPYTQDDTHDAMTTNGITENGSGLERWNILVNNYESMSSIDDMRTVLNKLKYTNTYMITTDSDVWHTEMVGINGLTAGTPYSEFASTFQSARTEYARRSRNNPKTWQTVHSVIYDGSDRSMYVVVQEDGEEIRFGFSGVDVPTKLSELENDVGYITVDDIPEETDPTVPAWAKQPNPPSAEDIGAVSATQGSEHAGQIMGVNAQGVVVPVNAPVTGVSSVNDMTGDVTITAEGIGAYEKPVGGIPSSDMASAVQTSLIKADNAATQSALNTEVANRQQANNELQEQIDALVSKSDVVDVVGTYADLQNYDTTKLGNNDVVKVLSDSMHSNGRSYYRWVITGTSGSWSYVGTESVGYTKAETDELLNDKQDSIFDLDNIRSLAEGAVQTESDPVFSASPAYGITNQNIQDWNAKQNTIDNLDEIEEGAAAGSTAVQPDDLGAVATSNDYNDLNNKPTIPSKTSDLENDSAFITEDDVPVSSVNGQTGAVLLDAEKINYDPEAEHVEGSIGEAISEQSSAIANIMSKYKTITVTCLTQDGVTVTGQTVYLRNGDSTTSPVEQTKEYNGQPVTFEVPINYAYCVTVSDTLAGHFNPTYAVGTTDTDKSVVLTYADVASIRTFEDLQGAIPLAENNPSMIAALIGVEIPDSWTATNGTSYSDPMVVASLEYIEDADGATHWGAYIQRKYASFDSIQFDAAENEEATETTAQEGRYYYGQTGDTLAQTALTPLNLAVGASIPYSDYTKVYRNSIDDQTCYIVSNGYNNWRQSAYRQYLNSSEAVGHWWTEQHPCDMPPSQHTSVRGYMAGCSVALLAAVKPCKVSCNTNTRTDGGIVETVVDTFWLPSVTQMYGVGNTLEGDYWELWKRATGLNAPENDANDGRIFYSVNATTSAQNCRLRSAYRSYSYNAWIVTTSGNLYSSTASHSFRAAPACAIW